MSTNKRPTMLRLPEELYEKVRYMAYVERRSVNMQIEHALQQYVIQFEQAHGPIRLSDPLEAEESQVR